MRASYSFAILLVLSLCVLGANSVRIRDVVTYPTNLPKPPELKKFIQNLNSKAVYDGLAVFWLENPFPLASLGIAPTPNEASIIVSSLKYSNMPYEFTYAGKKYTRVSFEGPYTNAVDSENKSRLFVFKTKNFLFIGLTQWPNFNQAQAVWSSAILTNFYNKGL